MVSRRVVKTRTFAMCLVRPATGCHQPFLRIVVMYRYDGTPRRRNSITAPVHRSASRKRLRFGYNLAAVASRNGKRRLPEGAVRLRSSAWRGRCSKGYGVPRSALLHRAFFQMPAAIFTRRLRFAYRVCSTIQITLGRLTGNVYYWPDTSLPT